MSRAEGRTNFLGWNSPKTIMSNHNHNNQIKDINPYCTWVGDKRKGLALYPTIYGHISLLLPDYASIPAQKINSVKKLHHDIDKHHFHHLDTGLPLCINSSTTAWVIDHDSLDFFLFSFLISNSVEKYNKFRHQIVFFFFYERWNFPHLMHYFLTHSMQNEVHWLMPLHFV